MLGVLLESLIHFPAVLADFYFSGSLNEGIVDPDLDSDDDDWHHSPSQVKCSLLANSEEQQQSASPVHSADPSSTYLSRVKQTTERVTNPGQCAE